MSFVTPKAATTHYLPIRWQRTFLARVRLQYSNKLSGPLFSRSADGTRDVSREGGDRLRVRFMCRTMFIERDLVSILSGRSGRHFVWHGFLFQSYLAQCVLGYILVQEFFSQPAGQAGSTQGRNSQNIGGAMSSVSRTLWVLCHLELLVAVQPPIPSNRPLPFVPVWVTWRWVPVVRTW
jgi:hypothetical protein